MPNKHNLILSNKEIDVIIHLSEEPIISLKHTLSNRVKLQQQNILNEMTIRNIQVKNIHMYSTVLNAISAIIKTKDIAQLLTIKGVQSIEPNKYVKAMGISSTNSEASFDIEVDPLFLEIKALWAEGINGKGVKVAVLDSGIDKDHPDLKDAFKGGINFIDQSNPEEYKSLRDDNDPSETSPNERPDNSPVKYPATGAPFETYHGTHIAGIIAGNNQNGVKGIAPEIDLYAYRVLGAYTSGNAATIIKGIEEAVIQKMDIINLSLSDDSDLESHALSVAINNAVLAGVVAVSTAGNAGSVRGSVRAPGTSRLGISVGNSTLSDEVDGSSSRGPSRPNFDIKPDIVAPGTEIISTMPRYCAEDPVSAYKDSYKIETGTSQSAPYIAGIAALIKQAHPDWKPFDIKVAISNTAKVLDMKTYTVFDQGAGRIQPYAATRPSILAYATENIDVNGKGKFVQNKKGSVTFGTVSLNENVSITKPIVIKDIKGDGGVFKVLIHVTEPFGDAVITVDQPSFILNGDCLLHVTLTVSKNNTPKYRDEILGYLYIINHDKNIEVSLPFAADFSGGATVIPAIEEFSITKKDISFNAARPETKVDVTLSINSDLSYPSLEITDYLSKAPIDSLFYDNGLTLGTRKFPLLHKYTSSWTNEDTILQDGIYSIDFTGMAKAELLTNTIGPVFVKSNNPIIKGSINNFKLSGQVLDQYIDFNNSLTELSEPFDLNEKLFASYTLTIKGKSNKAVSFSLNQDGTYAIELDSPQIGIDFIKVTIIDLTGNTGETIFKLENY